MTETFFFLTLRNCLKIHTGLFSPIRCFKFHPKRGIYLFLYIYTCFHGGSAGKESTCNAGDLGSIPGLGRSPGEGKGYPHQYSGLENSMDCIVHGGHKESDMTEWLSLHLIHTRGIYLYVYTHTHTDTYTHTHVSSPWKTVIKYLSIILYVLFHLTDSFIFY